MHGAGLQTLLAAAAAGSWFAAQGSHSSAGKRSTWGRGGSGGAAWSIDTLNPFASGGGRLWGLSQQPRSWGFGRDSSAAGAGFGGALRAGISWRYAPVAVVAMLVAWLALCRSASLRLLTACAGD
jgi:hypothetical protein